MGLLLLSALLGACKVERTPQELVDHFTPEQHERAAAAAEVEDRMLALAQALNREDMTGVLGALEPAEDAYLVGPEVGGTATGREGISEALRRAAGSPIDVEMRDLVVSVGPRATVAWFRGSLEDPGDPVGSGALRVTGVYIRDAGVWRLVQAHLSRAVTDSAAAPPSSPPVTGADSVGGE